MGECMDNQNTVKRMELPHAMEARRPMGLGQEVLVGTTAPNTRGRWPPLRSCRPPPPDLLVTDHRQV